MTKLWLGAVAYDPKVVTIWEGMRSFFRDEAKLDVEIVLYLSYEAQVEALLAPEPRIDIAWNTNLAFLQSRAWSDGRCAPLAMRDTDIGWTTKIIALKGGAVKNVDELLGKTLALGSRDSGHAAILPVHFLEAQGLVADKDYKALRFDLDVGKHGDTGTSELDVLKSVLDGRADAGAVGSPFWSGVLDKKLVPDGAVVDIWTSEPYSHCMFTGRVGLDQGLASTFVAALDAMSWDNPKHRPVLEAEGLKKWLHADEGGYDSLRAAAKKQGFFERTQR